MALDNQKKKFQFYEKKNTRMTLIESNNTFCLAYEFQSLPVIAVIEVCASKIA